MPVAKCVVQRPPVFVENSRFVKIESCRSVEGDQGRLGRFIVGDTLVSEPLKNGLVMLAKRIYGGRASKTEYDSRYQEDDIDTGLELDFYKDKIGFMKKSNLRVRVGFISVCNMPIEYSNRTRREQVTFNSLYDVTVDESKKTLSLNQIKPPEYQLFQNSFIQQRILLNFK